MFDKSPPISDDFVSLDFNPDILVNRFNLLIRIAREIEVNKNEKSLEFLNTAAKITLHSIEIGLQDDDDATTLH
jgi:hypothetical protein|tara:strand:- start:445 stop:666 length:222 start_codon:yes stop_codon:yes gene_type:complete